MPEVTISALPSKPEEVIRAAAHLCGYDVGYCTHTRFRNPPRTMYRWSAHPQIGEDVYDPHAEVVEQALLASSRHPSLSPEACASLGYAKRVGRDCPQILNALKILTENPPETWAFVLSHQESSTLSELKSIAAQKAAKAGTRHLGRSARMLLTFLQAYLPT